MRTKGLYLARWGLTPQKPMKKAYEQSPAAVKKWLDEDYPAIAARAKAEGAEIHWARAGLDRTLLPARGHHRAVREFFGGLLVLGGGIADGYGVAGAEAALVAGGRAGSGQPASAGAAQP